LRPFIPSLRESGPDAGKVRRLRQHRLSPLWVALGAAGGLQRGKTHTRTRSIIGWLLPSPQRAILQLSSTWPWPPGQKWLSSCPCVAEVNARPFDGASCMQLVRLTECGRTADGKCHAAEHARICASVNTLGSSDVIRHIFARLSLGSRPAQSLRNKISRVAI
jgi:hypothetical protein